MSDIDKINKTIETYFEQHTGVTIIPAKELMPDFIKAGIFKNDIKHGKPIRDVLRELKKNNQLQLIPFVHAEQKDKNTNWYFIPANAPKPTTFYKQESPSVKKAEAIQSRLQSDESYVIDLCDAALELVAERQKRFSFLLGDLHKDGVSRTKLPVDAYYRRLSLVIEYKEPQHTEENAFFDKPHVKTVSGVSRDEQRRMYDKRRATDLPKNGIQLIEISYTHFNCDSQNKIIRNREEDLKMVKELLQKKMDVIDNQI